jgi:hypothetical protein
MDPRVKPGGDDLLAPTICWHPKKKNPALRRDFPALAYFTSELAAALLALIAVLALTVRVLLLLAGLLPAALLALLAGLLTRVLILLARILVLVGHRRSPLLNVTRDN